MRSEARTRWEPAAADLESARITIAAGREKDISFVREAVREGIEL